MTTFLSLLCLAKNVSEKLLLSRWNLRTLSPPSSTSPSLAPRWRASSYSTTWLRIQLCSRFQIKCRFFSASFSSQGRGADQGGDYQFDIYRSMKQHNQVLIVWMQTFCRQWRSPPNLHLLRTLGPYSRPEAMCCGCIIFSPRFIRQKSSFISPHLPFLPISYNRWPLRGRCITQARQKRRPSFINQARYETFFNYLDVKMYFFRPFKDERLEEATIGVQLCCRMGEKGGGEGGWHVKLNMVRLDKDKW